MQNNCIPKNHAHKEWKIIFPLLRIIEWNCPQLSVNNPFSFFSTLIFLGVIDEKRKNNNIFWQLLLIFMKFTLCATTVLLMCGLTISYFLTWSFLTARPCSYLSFSYLPLFNIMESPLPRFRILSLSPKKCSGICLLKMMSWEPAATHTDVVICTHLFSTY